MGEYKNWIIEYLPNTLEVRAETELEAFIAGLKWMTQKVQMRVRRSKDVEIDIYKDKDTKFIPIVMEDYKFLVDNCGVGWDDNYVEENEPLLKRMKEIEERYKELVRE